VPPLITFGHGTAGQDELLELLYGAGVALVVDIRTAPGSRRWPHVGRAELEQWLPAADISYRWEARLGGFRKAAADSPDVVWRNASFRGYAGYTRQPEFAEALDQVLVEGEAAATAMMCSESLWWRCHRRLVADFAVLARARPVQHLMHDGRLVDHVPTAGVRLRADGLLVYDQLENQRGPADKVR
jgi:uncharacterized protein (DUF488 family)